MLNKHNLQKKNIFVKSTHFKKSKAGIISDGVLTIIAIDYRKLSRKKEEDAIIKELLRKKDEHFRRLKK